jgi:hypothetical protein
MEFLIYTGVEQEITVSQKNLTKVYRFKRDLPVPINHESDRINLLRYVEVRKTSCCGGRSQTRPLITDITYCRFKKLNVIEFRSKWEKEYQNQ